MKTSLCLTVQEPSVLSPFEPKDLETGLEYAKKGGFDGIELIIRDPNKVDAPWLKGLLDKYGLKAASISVGQMLSDGLWFASFDPQVRMGAVQRMCDYMKLATKIGYCRVNCGMARGVGSKEPVKFTQEMEFIADCLAQCAKYAENTGIKLNLEAINRYEINNLNSIADTLAFINRVGNPKNVGVLYDTFHANIEDADMVQALAMCRNKLFHVHIADSNRKLPGYGHIDFKPIVAQLKKMDYDGYACLELPCANGGDTFYGRSRKAHESDIGLNRKTEGKKMKVAIIGAGQRGTIYAKALKEFDYIERAAVVDVFEDAARALANEYGYQNVYTDYNTMLKTEKPDVAVVCTSAQTHSDIAIAAFENGAHVFSEKPIELSMAKAAKMLEIAKEKKRNLGIGLQYRCRSTYRAIKRAMEAGVISTPMVYRFTDFRQVRPKIAFHNVYENGGPIMDTLCHFVDLMGWYFESVPESVDAYGFTIAGQRPELASIEHIAIDTGVIHLQFASGDIGCLDVCWGLPKDTEDYLRFDGVCAKGRVEVRRVDPNPLAEADIYIHVGNREEKLIQLNEKDRKETAYPEKTLLAEFFDEIKKGDYSYETAQAAFNTLSVSLAALKSIRLQRRVTIAEINEEKPEVDKYMI